MSWWWGVPWILPLVLFCGRAVVIRREANPGIRPWQDLCEMRSRTTGGGKISPWCVLGRPSVAIFSRDASPDALPWQVFRFMHPRRGPGREKRPSLATYRRHASKTSWLWQDMRAMHPKSAANRRWRIHHARILPGRGPFRCTDPSNHALRANLAIPPAPPNSASAAASVSAPSARPIALKRGPEADVTCPTVAPRTARALATPTLAAANRQAAFPECGASLAPVAIKVAVAFRLPYA